MKNQLSLVLVAVLATPALADNKPAATKPSPPAPAPAAAAKMVVTPAANVKWQPLDPKNPMGLQTSLIHGDIVKGPTAFLLKLPAGSKSGLHAHTNDYYGLVVSGTPGHGADEKGASTPLSAGAEWFQPGKQMHFDTCHGDKECVILLMYPAGGFDYIPGPSDAKKDDKKPVSKDAAKKPAK